MAKNAGISARISGDPKPLKQAQDAALVDTQAWVNKMVGLNSSIQKSYNSLAFSGPQGRMKSPISQLADEDAKAWARRMSDTQKHSQAWGRSLNGGAGMAMLQLSQTVDDLQYGIKGVLNNIAPLVMSMGGRAGLAGVVAATAVGVYQLYKELGKLALGLNNVDEAQRGLEPLVAKLDAVAATRAKEAIEGTAAAAQELALAVEQADKALSKSENSLQLAADRTSELARAQAELAMARGGNDPVAVAGVATEAQINAAETAHAATMKRLHEERDAHYERARALGEYAKQKEREAAEAKNVAASVPFGADPFIAKTTFDAYRAAQVDADKARAAADDAHNVSLERQLALSEEINQRRAVHEKQIAAMRIRAAEAVAEAEKEVVRAAEAQSKAQIDAIAAAEERSKNEAIAANNAKKRALEAEREAVMQIQLNRAKAAGNAEEVRRLEGERRFQAERDRLIGAGVAPDRASRAARAIVDSDPDAPRRGGRRSNRPGFSVDDVHRYQRGSLRGDMDAAMGRGYTRSMSPTERRSHEMRVEKAAENRENKWLQDISKSLDAIEKNTAGLSKTKSEPLTRA